MTRDYEIRTDSNRLKILRKSKGFTQPMIAAMLGISPASYQLKESGLYAFKDSEKLKICDLLEMDIAEFDDILFGGALKERGMLVEVPKDNADNEDAS